MLDKVSSLRGIETNGGIVVTGNSNVELDKVSSLRGIETLCLSESFATDRLPVR